MLVPLSSRCSCLESDNDFPGLTSTCSVPEHLAEPWETVACTVYCTCTVPLFEPKSKMLYTWWIRYWGDVSCQVYLITASDYKIPTTSSWPSHPLLTLSSRICLEIITSLWLWPWNFGFQFKQVGKVLTPQASSRVELKSLFQDCICCIMYHVNVSFSLLDVWWAAHKIQSFPTHPETYPRSRTSLHFVGFWESWDLFQEV